MELMKCSEVAQEKLSLTRRELQEIVVLTSKFTTQVGLILTNNTDHLFSSLGIATLLIVDMKQRLFTIKKMTLSFF